MFDQGAIDDGAVQRSQELAATLRSRRIDHHRPLVRSLIKKVVVSETALSIQVRLASTV